MKTAELLLQLPEDDVRFLEQYAKERAISLADLISQYARLLQRVPHLDNLAITDVIPPEVDARADYRASVERKHR